MQAMKEYEKFIEQHAEVKAWLKDRPENTRRIFARELKAFCTELGTTPEEWRSLDKFKARNMAWQYITTKTANNPSVASTVMAALKSFYRNKDGEALPFDSARGGKHYFHVGLKKGAIEHIPSKTETYQIIDMASSLRDKAILLTLFQSGVRVNVVQHLQLKHVIDQLDKDVVTLKITPELDWKLRGREIPFYYTFLNGEGAETLKRYVTLAHKQRRLDAPLFSTSGHEAISQCYILRIVKNCCRKAGLDPKTMWTHSLRKAFRKIVRQADIDDDDKEQLMGHVIRGSRQSYYDKNETDIIMTAYQKCNFAREIPKSEVTKLRQQLEAEQTKSAMYEARLGRLEAQFESTRRMLKELLEKKET
jgi:site-specific recombinase XerD